MAKRIDTSIVNVFAWFSNVVDAQDLKLGDIGLLMHIIKNLNRNFWKPLKMSVYKIAKNSGSDDRTIRGALKRLAEKNILVLKDGDNFRSFDDPSSYFASKKFRQSDTSNYFSIILKDGEFFIGIESEENHFKRQATSNTPSNAPESPERNAKPEKVKTLANFF